MIQTMPKMAEMGDVRKAVTGAMKRQGVSRYRLVQMVKGNVARNTLYDWLAGTSDSLGSEALGHVLEALKLTISPQ